MRKAVMTTLSCLFLAAAFPTAAYAQTLVAGGQVVGIQIKTDGVMVAGVAPVETAEGSRSPAGDAGLRRGDFIMEIDGRAVDGAGDLISAVGRLAGKGATLTVLRQGQTLSVTVQPALSREDQWMLGMWLRDGISGIGTVTFYDPATGLFGALGHSISDFDTGVVVPLGKGSISEAEIVGVTPGSPGAPGELNGCADMGRVLGSVDANTGHGIFGHSDTPLPGRPLETGQVAAGPASILATVDGRTVRQYAVEINRLYRDSDGQHLMLTVTDPELLGRTGGIVQGMSGSPILQNGKLVAAVTHVFVNQPDKGYGISIQDMLRSAPAEPEQAA